MNDSNTNSLSSETSWDEAVVPLLSELLDVQQKMLDHLAEKREMLGKGDIAGMITHQEVEADLIGRLEACHQRRECLLQQAAEKGLPSQSLQHLSSALEAPQRQRLSPILAKASSQAGLLRHHSLTNWVLAQRHVIHISYLIEILATGGKLRPTYGSGGAASESGALVDQAG